MIVFLILVPASSPPVEKAHQGSGETPALATKLLRPVQLLQKQATLGTPLAPSEGTHSSKTLGYSLPMEVRYYFSLAGLGTHLFKAFALCLYIRGHENKEEPGGLAPRTHGLSSVGRSRIGKRGSRTNCMCVCQGELRQGSTEVASVLLHLSQPRAESELPSLPQWPPRFEIEAGPHLLSLSQESQGNFKNHEYIGQFLQPVPNNRYLEAGAAEL